MLTMLHLHTTFKRKLLFCVTACSCCLNAFSPGTLDSFHSPKTCKLGVRLIGHSKLPTDVNVSVNGCLSALR